MNYDETVAYLFSKLPMFSRVGDAAFKKDLTNIRQLCEALGNPEKKFKSIHVAGTNGKGSVSHMLSAILQKAGYKTGLYTSPHLYDFRERIRMNGEMVPEKFVVGFTEKIQPLIQQIQPSFFEITVAMAFEYFAEEKVDVAVIEVGLGGRLDSTNIISPELSIITNIGFDHTQMLGDQLEDIAREKAGIIKPDVPVVIGEILPQTKWIFELKARENKAPLYFTPDHFTAIHHQWQGGRLQVHYENRRAHRVEKYETDLAGLYQVKNLATVLTALPILEDSFPGLREAAPEALKQVKKSTGLAGRWEVIHQNPKVVLEVAHNLNGMEQMLQHLAEENFDKLHIIIGVVKDKDITSMLKLLPHSAQYYFTAADIPRALDANELQQQAGVLGLKGETYADVNIALKASLRSAAAADLIIVCGSIFLVAEVDTSILQLTQVE